MLGPLGCLGIRRHKIEAPRRCNGHGRVVGGPHIICQCNNYALVLLISARLEKPQLLTHLNPRGQTVVEFGERDHSPILKIAEIFCAQIIRIELFMIQDRGVNIILL
jgi:hypothetical protein